MYLETDRLVIRNFCMDDAVDLQEILGDAQTMQYSEPAYDLHKTRQFLEDFCIGQKGAVAAVQKASGKVIGYILFKEYTPENYEIGWFFNRAYWRQGYAYESCHALIEDTFANRNARKIFAETTDGIKSAGLMKKLGMKLEEVQKAQVKDVNGAWVDLYQYGIEKCGD